MSSIIKLAQKIKWNYHLVFVFQSLSGVVTECWHICIYLFGVSPSNNLACLCDGFICLWTLCPLAHSEKKSQGKTSLICFVFKVNHYSGLIYISKLPGFLLNWKETICWNKNFSLCLQFSIVFSYNSFSTYDKFVKALPFYFYLYWITD